MQISSKSERGKKKECNNYQSQEWNGDSTLEPADIKRIVREYTTQLCTHKFDN
jgi:hypothetical protein